MERFDRTERWLHWANAVLVGVLVATGAVLYWGELSSVFGRRALFKEVHVIAGLVPSGPVPAGPAGSAGPGAAPRPRRPQPLQRRRPPLAAEPGRRPDRPPREVQPRPEAQHRLRRRGAGHHAGHRSGAALLQPVPVVVADGRHLHPRLDGPRPRPGRSPAMSVWPWPTPTPSGHGVRPGAGLVGPPEAAPLVSERPQPRSQQEAQRPAHDRGPLVGAGDVLETEAEQEAPGGFDDGAGGVAGRARRIAPARPR